MDSLSAWSNYDYNGVIFVFGRIDSTLTDNWKSITSVEMLVDYPEGYTGYDYRAEIKDIPYTQNHSNNTNCKVFNINTYTHRKNDNCMYQFKPLTNNKTCECNLNFYADEALIAQTSITVTLHNVYSNSFSVGFDHDTGIVEVTMDDYFWEIMQKNSPRFYIDIRRKDRSIVNPDMPWQDKDYIHTVAMKGIEGGKYNEGIPHTGFMARGNAQIAGSVKKTVNNNIAAISSLYSNDVMLTSTSSTVSKMLNVDEEITFISDSRYRYYVFTATQEGYYHFWQSNNRHALWIELYSDSNYSSFITGDYGSGGDCFDIVYKLNKDETVYIKIYDTERNKQAITIGVKAVSVTATGEFGKYTLEPKSAIVHHYNPDAAGFITLYTGKKRKRLLVNGYEAVGKTPYGLISLSEGDNYFSVSNPTTKAINYWFSPFHNNEDYQPYWRNNPLNRTDVCIVFDNDEIYSNHGLKCLELAKSAFSKLAKIISKAKGEEISFNIVNLGVSKLYLDSNENARNTDSCLADYYNAFNYDYSMTVRFGVNNTTLLSDNGTATSGNSGQGKWDTYRYFQSAYGVEWSIAIINIDNADIYETLSHVVHEEIYQSLGIGDDCYSREESVHWDPEYSNADYYTGIDETILKFTYENDLNGYTQFDLCNEFDLPIVLFKEYKDMFFRYGVAVFQFRLKDPCDNWLLRSGEYEVCAWCVTQGSDTEESTDGWDNDLYSLRTEPTTITIEGDDWYWSDFGIDMKKGLLTDSIPYAVWNSFIEAVFEVMDNGVIPDDTAVFEEAAGKSFDDAVILAKIDEKDKTLYAFKFNIINYIINQTIETDIDAKYPLDEVLAQYMLKLEECRNMM